MPKGITRKRVPKYIPNPEYHANLHIRRRELANSGFADYPPEDVDPQEYGKALPEDGAWIMLLISVHVARETTPGSIDEIDVPHLSIWYALPHATAQGLWQAVIQTPSGPVHVWPHEYNLVQNLSGLLECDDESMEIHFMSESGGFDEKALFYLRSKGIGKREAERMLLPNIKDPFCCYFTMSDDIRGFFREGTGTSYWPGRATRKFRTQPQLDTEEE